MTRDIHMSMPTIIEVNKDERSPTGSESENVMTVDIASNRHVDTINMRTLPDHEEYMNNTVAI